MWSTVEGQPQRRLAANDITQRFSLDKVDHDELLAIFDIRYHTSWRISDDEIAFPAANDHRLKVQVRHGRIAKIVAGDSLSGQELDELLDQVKADLMDDRIAEYGSLPMQILPPPPEAPLPPSMGGDHPFVLEYPIRAWRTPALRHRRRFKNVLEWALVLNALLYGSIKHSGGPRSRHLWAVKSGEFEPCFWAKESYVVPGYPDYVNALAGQGVTLPVVPAQEYFGDRNKLIRADLIDRFFVPDNLDKLIAAFSCLEGAKRRRFLQSAAAIYATDGLWDVSVSSYFLACVQAIETFVDPLPRIPCSTCKKDIGPGPTKRFRETIEKYRGAVGVDKKVLDGLYRVRSALTHGSYLFQMDEAPWSVGYASSVMQTKEFDDSRLATTVAREVLRNWLLSQAP
jgi:hypothetical protein